MKSLGIVITSDQYPQYISPMVRAAHANGVNVHLHLTGAGVRLMDALALDALVDYARITICSNSADAHPISLKLKSRYANLMTNADEMVRLIDECDRHVML